MDIGLPGQVSGATRSSRLRFAPFMHTVTADYSYRGGSGGHRVVKRLDGKTKRNHVA